MHSETFYMQRGSKVTLTPLKESRSINGNSVDYFKTSRGTTVGLGYEMIIKFTKGADREAILARYKLTTKEDLTQDMTVVSVSKESFFDTLHALYNENAIEFAEPNFYQQRILR
jgi:hypothetical protein